MRLAFDRFEQLLDPQEQFLAGEGFGQIAFTLRVGPGTNKAAGAENGNAWETKLDLLDQFAPAHLGHHQVGDYQVDGRPAVDDQLERFRAAVGGENLVTEGRQDSLAHGIRMVCWPPISGVSSAVSATIFFDAGR